MKRITKTAAALIASAAFVAHAAAPLTEESKSATAFLNEAGATANQLKFTSSTRSLDGWVFAIQQIDNQGTYGVQVSDAHNIAGPLKGVPFHRSQAARLVCVTDKETAAQFDVGQHVWFKAAPKDLKESNVQDTPHGPVRRMKVVVAKCEF